MICITDLLDGSAPRQSHQRQVPREVCWEVASRDDESQHLHKNQRNEDTVCYHTFGNFYQDTGRHLQGKNPLYQQWYWNDLHEVQCGCSTPPVNLKYNRVHYREAIYKWHPPSPTAHVLSCAQATCAFTRSEPYQPLKLYLFLPTFVCVNIFWKRYTYCITIMFSVTYALIASVSFVL